MTARRPESALIEDMLSVLPAARGQVLLGPGDDAAVTASPTGRLVAAADLLVEGRHFDLAFSSWADAGFKAVAVNVSDLAAMGARPLYALVSIGLPASQSGAVATSVYTGLAEACDAFGVDVIGGDTVGADVLTISVAVIGEASDVVTRGGAREGDVVSVTGSLGAAAAGLMLLRAQADPAARDLLDRFPGLVEAHRRGRARVREGAAALSHGAHAMIDVSDGLASDAGHIADRSGVAIALDLGALPVAPGVAEAASFLGVTVEQIVLGGGDDYELVVAIEPASLESLRASTAPTPLTAIGVVEAGEGLRDAHGRAVEQVGWDHFA